MLKKSFKWETKNEVEIVFLERVSQSREKKEKNCWQTQDKANIMALYKTPIWFRENLS